MARSYAKLYVEVWDAEGDFRQLTAGAQRLYWLLCSQPQLSAAGVLPLQPRRWARLATDTTDRQIARALAELVSTCKVIIDEGTEECLVRAFIRRDGGTKTPNILKAIRQAIDAIESDCLRKVAAKELERTLATHE